MSALSDMLEQARLAEQRRAMTHSGQYNNDRARAEAWNELRTAPARLAQGAFTGLAGAPVDIANMAMKPLGLGSESPVGGSNYLASLINAPTESSAYKAGTMLPIGPEGLAIGAKAFIPALASALGATAIASRASRGGKLTELAQSMPNQRGIFAGVGAKTANLAELVRAEEMAKVGVPDAQIWKETGWSLNTPDKMPRFEIPDNAATAQYTHLAERGGDRLAPRAIEHPELYRAYPNANEITQLGLRDSAETGSIDAAGGFLTAKAPTEQGLKSVGLHELQHAIQQREGFAIGGSTSDTSLPTIQDIGSEINKKYKDIEQKIISSPEYQAKVSEWLTQNPSRVSPRTGNVVQNTADDARYKINHDPLDSLDAMRRAELDKVLNDGGTNFLTGGRYEAYKRLAGEAEARLTQARMNMTPEQRLAQYPFEPEYFNQATGVPLKDLIVRTK
jgi:hypothetical protein